MSRKLEAKNKYQRYKHAIHTGYYSDGVLGAIKAWFRTTRQILLEDASK